MGLASIRVGWLQECLESPSFSVLINSSPVFFNSNGGTRHGNPLSPYIFVLIMEFWSVHMELSLASARLSPLKRVGVDQVSHLLFAEDMLIYCKVDKSSFKELNIT